MRWFTLATLLFLPEKRHCVFLREMSPDFATFAPDVQLTCHAFPIPGYLTDLVEQMEVKGVQVSLFWDVYPNSITMRNYLSKKRLSWVHTSNHSFAVPRLP